MGFSRQEYWSGLPCPPPGDIPDPGNEPAILCLANWEVGSLPLTPPGKPFGLGEREEFNLLHTVDIVPKHSQPQEKIFSFICF